MIFYASALSSYSAKVRLVLCVKGVTFEERPPPNGYRSPEYRAIVPMGTLPALQIGDFVLSESEAINEYLEEIFPEPAMLPRDPQLRARLRFLSRFHDLYLEPKVRALFPHARSAARDHAQVAALRQDIERHIDQLSQWTRPQPYLLTSFISLADCGPLVTLQLARELLAACSQPIKLSGKFQDWMETAWRDPAVEQALAPWRAATRAWLTQSTA